MVGKNFRKGYIVSIDYTNGRVIVNRKCAGNKYNKIHETVVIDQTHCHLLRRDLNFIGVEIKYNWQTRDLFGRKIRQQFTVEVPDVLG